MTVSLTSLIILSLVGAIGFLAYRYHHLKQTHANTENELGQLKITLNEITGELDRIEAESRTPSMVDQLTGLPTHQVFEDRLKQTIHNSQRQQSLFAVLALDIDNLSQIDKLGEDLGDNIIKEIAQRFQVSIRQVDTVSRVAGGYFLFLLPRLSRPETAIYVAQRVQDNLLDAIKIGGYEVKVTVSMGIAVYPVDGADSNTLTQLADSALKQAKRNGKNKYQFYQSELHHLGEKELSISKLIRSGELTQHLMIQYRPYFDSVAKKVVYIQATPHLHHPKYGVIPFTNYRNVAENSGKMLEINAWLLRESIQKYKAWKQNGLDAEILAIPVSLKQLENAHFIYTLKEIREELNAKAITLVLEVMDDNMPQNSSYIENLFLTLSEENIKVSVGVIALGHFAIQKINKIPLAYLRIDAELIKQATQHQDKEGILIKLIELAKDENIIVMAEGVENENQKNRLIRLGCQLMEGKLFGVMMPTGSVLETEN